MNEKRQGTSAVADEVARGRSNGVQSMHGVRYQVKGR